jgi:hypothetical protein
MVDIEDGMKFLFYRKWFLNHSLIMDVHAALMNLSAWRMILHLANWMFLKGQKYFFVAQDAIMIGTDMI